MVFPREVLVGHNVIEQTAKLCKNLGLTSGSSCLIVTGKITKKIAGKLVQSILRDSDYNTQLLAVGEANKECVEKVTLTGKEIKADFLVGVGGGSKIDIAKLAAKGLEKPFISVPTSAAHDGIASPRASIKNNQKTISISAITPLGIVADTAIIVKAPYRTLASGCSDVISNLTAIKDWLLAFKLKKESIFSSSASVLSAMSGRIVIDNASSISSGSEESVWLAIKPIIESGAAMCIAGSSRPCSGSEHLFSHALDILAPGKALHGEQCGVGTIMMMALHNSNWQEVRDSLRELHAPTSAKELGIEEELIIEALLKAPEIRPERYTILSKKKLTWKTAEELARATEVI
jgi:glycerol-1-phosphate dehydrogenase [NAD(P)+]